MRLQKGLSLLVTAASVACARPPAGVATSAGDGPPSRSLPPIRAAACDKLSPEALQEAASYALSLSRATPVYRRDFRLPEGASNNPPALIGVRLYVPAERGVNRAYLERILSCHARKQAAPHDHPNDPFLSAGITALEVVAVDGGQYRVTVMVHRRADGDRILEKAHALQQKSGSIQVQQMDADR